MIIYFGGSEANLSLGLLGRKNHQLYLPPRYKKLRYNKNANATLSFFIFSDLIVKKIMKNCIANIFLDGPVKKDKDVSFRLTGFCIYENYINVLF